ncbi:MAG: hypothetical protein HY818_04130 [Acetobacterium woodii]|nr:hypothetical protein [Acetobacterium woodii]
MKIYVVLGFGKASSAILIPTLLNYTDENTKIIVINRMNNELMKVLDENGCGTVDIINSETAEMLQTYQIKEYNNDYFKDFCASLASNQIGLLLISDEETIKIVLSFATAIFTCVGPSGLSSNGYGFPDLLKNTTANVIHLFENDQNSCKQFELITKVANPDIKFEKAMIHRFVTKRYVDGNSLKVFASKESTVMLYDEFQIFKEDPNSLNNVFLKRLSSKNEVGFHNEQKYLFINVMHVVGMLIAFHKRKSNEEANDWVDFSNEENLMIDLLIKSIRYYIQKKYMLFVIKDIKQFDEDVRVKIEDLKKSDLNYDRLFPMNDINKFDQRNNQVTDIIRIALAFGDEYCDYQRDIQVITDLIKSSWTELAFERFGVVVEYSVHEEELELNDFYLTRRLRRLEKIRKQPKKPEEGRYPMRCCMTIKPAPLSIWNKIQLFFKKGNDKKDNWPRNMTRPGY